MRPGTCVIVVQYYASYAPFFCMVFKILYVNLCVEINFVVSTESYWITMNISLLLPQSLNVCLGVYYTNYLLFF